MYWLAGQTSPTEPHGGILRTDSLSLMARIQFAIALTLLILDVKLPSTESITNTAESWRALRVRRDAQGVEGDGGAGGASQGSHPGKHDCPVSLGAGGWPVATVRRLGRLGWWVMSYPP